MTTASTQGDETRIVVAASDPETRRWIRQCLGGAPALAVATGKEAMALLEEELPQILLVGPALEDMSGARLLSMVKDRHEIAERTVALYAAVREAQEAPPEDAVFFVIRPGMSLEDVRAILVSAVRRARARADEARARSVSGVFRLQRILDVSRRLAGETELRRAADMAVETVTELLSASRAYCLFHDSASGALWTEAEEEDEAHERHANAGIAGFAARTGRPVCVETASADPRYAAVIDDAVGKGDERLLVQPVAAPSGEIHAVLVAVRESVQGPFGPKDRETMAQLAEQWGPVLHQLALKVETDAAIAEQRSDLMGGRDLFRREAVEAHAAEGQQGDVIRVSPDWMGRAYWLLLLVLFGGGVYLFLGRVSQYATGPAIVQDPGRVEVTAQRGGSLTQILVEPGDVVEEGQVLARFYSAEEEANLRQVESQYEDALVDRMRDLSDETARRVVAERKTLLERARAALEERTVFAPRAGRVTDLRAQPGSALAPGDVILALSGGETDLSVVAFLPGQARPQLRPGQRLRFQLQGQRAVYEDMAVEWVSDVVSPAEALRSIGLSPQDGLAVTGPVVVVRARLPRDTFELDGERFRYHDGMEGTGEVRTKSERIIVALVPGLEEVL